MVETMEHPEKESQVENGTFEAQSENEGSHCGPRAELNSETQMVTQISTSPCSNEEGISNTQNNMRIVCEESEMVPSYEQETVCSNCNESSTSSIFNGSKKRVELECHADEDLKSDQTTDITETNSEHAVSDFKVLEFETNSPIEALPDESQNGFPCHDPDSNEYDPDFRSSKNLGTTLEEDAIISSCGEKSENASSATDKVLINESKESVEKTVMMKEMKEKNHDVIVHSIYFGMESSPSLSSLKESSTEVNKGFQFETLPAERNAYRNIKPLVFYSDSDSESDSESFGTKCKGQNDEDDDESNIVSDGESYIVSDENNVASDDDSGHDTDSSDDSYKNSSKKIPKNRRKKGLTARLRTDGELFPEELPPLEYLTISVAEDVVLEPLGSISGIVDILVIIQAFENTPALYDDSVLFLENREPLGVTFETFGTVGRIFYSVRFNSTKDITSRKIAVGDKVMYAPKANNLSKFVFLSEIRRTKLDDASWEFDNEAPFEVRDYSDDEEEKRAKAILQGIGAGKKKRKRRSVKKKSDPSTAAPSESSDSGLLPGHMNRNPFGDFCPDHFDDYSTHGPRPSFRPPPPSTYSHPVTGRQIIRPRFGGRPRFHGPRPEGPFSLRPPAFEHFPNHPRPPPPPPPMGPMRMGMPPPPHHPPPPPPGGRFRPPFDPHRPPFDCTFYPPGPPGPPPPFPPPPPPHGFPGEPFPRMPYRHF